MIEIDSLLSVTKDRKPIGSVFEAAHILTETEFNEGLASFFSSVTDLSLRLQKVNALSLEHEIVIADRDRIAKLLADASAAFDVGDVATLTTMRAAALQTENEKKLATALAKKAEAEAEIAALTE
jgi:hypothetical protein